MGRSVSKLLCSIGVAHWYKAPCEGKKLAQLGFSLASVEQPYSNVVGSSTLTMKPIAELKSCFSNCAQKCFWQSSPFASSWIAPEFFCNRFAKSIFGQFPRREPRKYNMVFLTKPTVQHIVHQRTMIPALSKIRILADTCRRACVYIGQGRDFPIKRSPAICGRKHTPRVPREFQSCAIGAAKIDFGFLLLLRFAENCYKGFLSRLQIFAGHWV